MNANGTRFVNEAAPYSDVVHVMYDRDRAAPGSHIPAWLIVDQNYRNRYLFKDILPTLPFPDAWYAAGAAKKAWTWDALAGQIGVPAGALRATLNRFNAQAWNGTDADFHRGASAYDHYYTDPAVHPNSCLAPVWVPPFHAFRIVPGDLGTKGGIVTDARAGPAAGRLGDPRAVRGGQRQCRGDGPQLRGGGVDDRSRDDLRLRGGERHRRRVRRPGASRPAGPCPDPAGPGGQPCWKSSAGSGFRRA